MNIPERISEIRRVRDGKALELERHRKNRPDEWIKTHEIQIRCLDWAARYIEKTEGASE